MMSKVRNVSKEPGAAHEGLGGRGNVPSPRRGNPTLRTIRSGGTSAYRAHVGLLKFLERSLRSVVFVPHLEPSLTHPFAL
jgi:hypothetical protein